MLEQSTPKLCRCGCGMSVKPHQTFLGGSHLRKRFTDEERFWLYVDKSDGPSACWLWVGGRSNRLRYEGRNAYGAICIDGVKTHGHKAAWTMASGFSIPDGFDVCHTCDVPLCVRNDDPGIYVVNGIARPRFGHLWLGTHQDNMADMAAKKRHPYLIPYESRARGERSGRAKLTEADVQEIRRLRASNVGHMFTPGRWTLRLLSERFGVDEKVIHNICTRKIWAHVV